MVLMAEETISELEDNLEEDITSNRREIKVHLKTINTVGRLSG